MKRQLLTGLKAINIETNNYVNVHKDMEVEIGEEVVLGNGKTYTIEDFNSLGFAIVRPTQKRAYLN